MDADMAANPQPTFKLLRDEMPVLSIDIGSNPGVLLSRKEDIDFALRHPEIFSSNVDAVDLKNKRPMIPLQIDPPEHKKFRKLLDPIFAPRKMAAMDQEVSDARQPPHRRLHRAGRGGLRQGVLRPLPLGGLPHPPRPAARRAGHVPHHEGRHHPPRPRDREALRVGGGQAYQQKIADSVYDYFNKILDQREKERQGRPALAFPRRRGRGRPPDPRGHPRHLLPLPDRRARHRHGHARLHVRLPGASIPSTGASSSRTPTSSPTPSRSSSAGRPRSWVSPASRWRTPSSPVAPCTRAITSLSMIGSANTDEAEFPDARRGALRPRGQPPYRLRRRHPPLSGVAPGAPGAAGRAAGVAQADSRVRGRARTTRSSTRRASAPSTTSRCASRRGRSRVRAPSPAVGHVLGPAALVPVALLVATRRVRVPA